ncbi:hypothetical protein CPB85DRAFT_1330505 [Mucidula mucida]|nr:hypothetical protein CPB85DRAFT_1330505 [Mucidula mucida]
MTVFLPPPSSGRLPWIPDNMTTPQFILDFHHPIRPQRPNGVPWLVADKSGKRMDLEEIQTRTTGLAVSFTTVLFLPSISFLSWVQSHCTSQLSEYYDLSDTRCCELGEGETTKGPASVPPWETECRGPIWFVLVSSRGLDPITHSPLL